MTLGRTKPCPVLLPHSPPPLPLTSLPSLTRPTRRAISHGKMGSRAPSQPCGTSPPLPLVTPGASRLTTAMETKNTRTRASAPRCGIITAYIADFVRVYLEVKSDSHGTLLARIPAVQDLQAAWLILLLGASARANCSGHSPGYLRFFLQHDRSLRRCLSTLVGAEIPEHTFDLASLPLSLGVLGLQSAQRVWHAANWPSGAIPSQWWSNVTRTLRASWFVHCKVAAQGQVLVDAGFPVAVWDLARGLRPDPTPDEDPSNPKHGWQYWATQPLDGQFIDAVVWPRLPDSSRTMLRSQSGPLASVLFTCCPIARHTTFDAQIFRTLLLRRLWLTLSSSSRVCRCGRPLDSCGHHRAACAVVGVLGSRGFALESAAARVAGGRVTIDSRIQDMDIVAPNQLDERRIEVLADGLPCSTEGRWPWT